MLGSFAVAGLIARARPGGMALFVSAFLMTAAALADPPRHAGDRGLGLARRPGDGRAHAGLVLFFALFPDGRFAPRWARWPALAWCAVLVPPCLFPGAPFGLRAWPAGLYPLVLAAVFATGVAAQRYRSARAAGPVGRRQIRWVLYGGAVLALLALAFAVRDLGDPARGRHPAPPGSRWPTWRGSRRRTWPCWGCRSRSAPPCCATTCGTSTWCSAGRWCTCP